MTSQYGAYALRAGLGRVYARMRMHTPTRPGTHMHALMRKHAHTNQYVILMAFPLQQLFRRHASMLRYTHIACLVTTEPDCTRHTVCCGQWQAIRALQCAITTKTPVS
jgi:hypothetical protein